MERYGLQAYAYEMNRAAAEFARSVADEFSERTPTGRGSSPAASGRPTRPARS